MAFSVSYNLCAAEEAPEIIQITEQTEIAQTKTDKQTPSFLVRHADKLKKASYGLDALSIAAGIAVLHRDASIESFEPSVKKFDFSIRWIDDASEPTFFCSLFIKAFFNPMTKVLMSRKHTHNHTRLIKQLKKLDPSFENSDISFKELSFPIRHADTLKKVSYGFDILSPVCAVASDVLPLLLKNINHGTNVSIQALNLLTLATSELIKLFLDPATKYAMSKKQAFEIAVLAKRLQELQAKLDAAQQKKVATA